MNLKIIYLFRRYGWALMALFAAACAAPPVPTPAHPYDGVWEGRATGGPTCLGATTNFTIDTGIVSGHADAPLGYPTFAGTIGNDGTGVLVTASGRHLDLRINDNNFQIHGNINCGAAVFAGTRAKS